MFFRLSIACALLVSASAQEPGEGIPRGDRDGYVYGDPFFPGVSYDPAVPDPARLLGQPVGSRLARPGEIVAAFQALGAASPRVTVREHGRTHEGRPLVHAVIGAPANLAREDALLSDLQALFDPAGLSSERSAELLEGLPAVAYLGYSIHGDETSGADAALALGYHLAAAQGPEIEALLESMVIVLEPCMNPDGRARIVSMAESFSGYRASLDRDSMARGRWPFGRGNHYLFDMNRDWMAGVAPETRARWDLLGRWHPHLFVDGHEMGGYDTFLFYPQSTPRLGALPPRLLHWQGVLADLQGKAFDAFGWGYYTREWADAWYPGYSDAWGSLNGAIGMLYEQARVGGQPLRRESGEVVPYRQAVHGQVVASMASLSGLAANREAILSDWLDQRLTGLALPAEERDLVLAIEPLHGGSRVEPLVKLLLAQGVVVQRATEALRLEDAQASLPHIGDPEAFPAGSYVVPLAQAQSSLVRAYFEFDPRIDDATVAEERGRIVRGKGSRLYDVTAWDLVRQFGLQASWGRITGGALEPVAEVQPRAGSVVQSFEGEPYAWACDAMDDRSLGFVARALEKGLAVHVADEPFEPDAGGTRPRFARGSFLLRRHENPAGVDALVRAAALQSDARVVALRGGRAGDLDHPDLGGQHFTLLHRPRVALLGGADLSAAPFGHGWQYLDEVLRLPVTLLDSDAFGSVDLRRYNVLVIGDGRIDGWIESHGEALAGWVRGGGTLVAWGSAAAALAGSSAISLDVTLRRDALETVGQVRAGLRRRAAGLDGDDFSVAQIWGDEDPIPVPEASVPLAQDGEPGGDLEAPDAERLDVQRRAFRPPGSILAAILDSQSWMTGGLVDTGTASLAVPWSGTQVLWGEGEVPVRLLPPQHVRLAGLVWPEARERLGDGAWMARSPLGSGQVLLFAASPVFRGSWRGTARLLGNAVVLGPGLGTRQPSGW